MPVGFSLGRSYHARSISLPARSSTKQIHREHLIEKNLKNVEETRVGFSVLVNLYNYVIELLNMPLTQRAFTSYRHEHWVESWLEESVIFLDACGTARESILLLETSLRQIQSVLKRSALDNQDEDLVLACICSLKKLKKETNKSTLAALKMMSGESPMWAPLMTSVEGRHLVEVVRMLKEASVASNSFFRSTLMCLFGSHASAHSKGSRWASVRKVLVVPKREAFKEATGEVEEVDVVINTCLVVLQGLMRKNDRDEDEDEDDEVAIRGVCERLEGLERSLQGVENEMGSLFRCLIRTRVSFLNVLSH